MPTVVDKTRDEVVQWRAHLLARTRLSAEELAERAETYQLNSEEMDIWQTIQGLDYLLEEND
ncbi:hypothetical protein [Streptomyces griseus]|uniref:hypothetical protein n=1 Tax=Streptomyces griseus TaxID=1911 RepID=UPI0004CB8D3D|nr:hypothetical protein [Streptomyces griseus]